MFVHSHVCSSSLCNIYIFYVVFCVCLVRCGVYLCWAVGSRHLKKRGARAPSTRFGLVRLHCGVGVRVERSRQKVFLLNKSMPEMYREENRRLPCWFFAPLLCPLRLPSSLQRRQCPPIGFNSIEPRVIGSIWNETWCQTAPTVNITQETWRGQSAETIARTWGAQI